MKAYTKIPEGYGECPVCDGTGLGSELSEKEKDLWFNRDKTHRQCSNCGGQTMAGVGRGIVPLRKDGKPCIHDYDEKPGKWKCTTEYTCDLCGDSYTIDSSD